MTGSRWWAVRQIVLPRPPSGNPRQLSVDAPRPIRKGAKVAPMVTTFATLPDAREFWPDSEDIDDARLTKLLAAAFPACELFAPKLPADATYPTGVPQAYTVGQVMQARELYQAQQRGEQDVIGVGDYAIRSRPLIAAVKSLLRPERGTPGVG